MPVYSTDTNKTFEELSTVQLSKSLYLTSVIPWYHSCSLGHSHQKNSNSVLEADLLFS